MPLIGRAPIGWLLASLLVLFAVSLGSPVMAQPCLPDGDVNQDQNLTPADALLAFQHFLGLADPPLTDCQQGRANVRQPDSTSITPADALCIFRASLALPSCFPSQPVPEDATEIRFLVNTSHPLTVSVIDAAGQPVPEARVTFQLTAGDGTLSPVPSGATSTLLQVASDAAGRASVILTLGATPGLNVVEARAAELAPVVFTITGVVAESARGAVVVMGNTQSAPPGTALDVPFVVRVQDEFGAPVAGVAVTVRVTGEGAEIGALPPANAQRRGNTFLLGQTDEMTSAVAITNAQGEAFFRVQGTVGTEDIIAEVSVLDQEITVPIVVDGIRLPKPNNTSPVVTSPGTQIAVEGDAEELQITASDADNDPLRFSATNLPLGLSLDEDTGRISGTIDPNASQKDSDTVTVAVFDGTAMTEVPFTWIIINPAPVLATVGPQTVDEGSQQAVDVTATDPDGDPLTLSAALPAFATLTDNGDGAGRLTLAPGFDDAGSFSATITVTDTGTPPLADSETFTITVIAVNRPPTLTAIGTQTVNEGSVLAINITATDPDGDPLTLSAALPAFATFTDNGDGTGSLLLAPDFDDAGTFSATITAMDSATPPRTASETFMIVVNDVPQQPNPLRFTLQVDRSGAGTGTVTSVPAGIDCGTTCSQDYDAGTVVLLTAVPAPDSEFAGWSEAGCTESILTCQVTMDQMRTVTATFFPRPVLTVQVEPADGGTVTSAPVGITCPTDCTETYSRDTVVVLTATPVLGAEFTGWSGVVGCAPDGNDATCTVTMDQSRTVTANFTAGPIVECISGATGGDQIFRGFYLPDYPGSSLTRVELFLSADTPGNYTFTLELREATYDGALLGTSTAAVTLNGDTNNNQLTPFVFPAVPIAAGTTVTFALQQASGPPGTVFYAVPDDDNLNCPIVQTNDTSPPLSSLRRNGVEIRIFDEPSAGDIEGRVIDFVTGRGLDAVGIEFRNSSARVVGRTQSDDNGVYTLRLPAQAIRGMASRAGFISTTIDFAVQADTFTTVDVIALVPEPDAPGAVGGTIRDALTTDEGIAEVTIELRPGVNNTTDEVVASTRTDSAGVYAFSALPAGTYTAMLTRDGFLPNAFTVGVVGGVFTGEQDGTMSPQPELGEVRIILTWGEVPRDLDAHLTGPRPSGTPQPSSAPDCSSDPERFHLFYPCAEIRNGSPFLDDFTLDRDDIDGVGPETITLRRRLEGIYRYSVHDFTNSVSNESTALSNSGAQVRVFIGGSEQPRTFNVPPDIQGTVWTVFEFDGTTGDITPINTFAFEPDATNIDSF